MYSCFLKISAQTSVEIGENVRARTRSTKFFSVSRILLYIKDGFDPFFEKSILTKTI